MRRGLFALPIPVFVLLAYNAVVLLGGDPAVKLPAVVFGAPLASAYRPPPSDAAVMASACQRHSWHAGTRCGSGPRADAAEGVAAAGRHHRRTRSVFLRRAGGTGWAGWASRCPGASELRLRRIAGSAGAQHSGARSRVGSRL